MTDTLTETENSIETEAATEKASSGKVNLIGMTLADIETALVEMGEAKFRAKQIHSWIYVHCVRDFEAMTNIAKPLRDKLAERFSIGSLTIAEKQVSHDGTQKYLFRLADGQLVESVLMIFDERDAYSVCLSSQVGCAVNCDFCATGKLGFTRHLSAAEIVEQLLFIRHDSGIDVRNIVMMGQGEPLLNYDEVLKAIRLINQSAEIGMRHITLSTSGIVPAMDKLAEENLQLTLAVSLHAPNNTVRNSFMPINKKYPLETLVPSMKRYAQQTGRRLTVEYILLEGVNDDPKLAKELSHLLYDVNCLINLIPYNPIGEEYGYLRPSRDRVYAFKEALMKGPHTVTVRLERGADIAAACGQLKNLKHA